MRKILRLDINAERAAQNKAPFRYKELDAEVGKQLRLLTSKQKQALVQRAMSTGVMTFSTDSTLLAAEQHVTMEDLPKRGRVKIRMPKRFESTWFMCTYHHVDWVWIPDTTVMAKESHSFLQMEEWARQQKPIRKLWSTMRSH